MPPLSFSGKNLDVKVIYVQSNFCSLIAIFVLPIEIVVIHRDISSLMIIFFNLITCLLYNVLIVEEEIRFKSFFLISLTGTERLDPCTSCFCSSGILHSLLCPECPRQPQAWRICPHSLWIRRSWSGCDLHLSQDGL